MRKIYQKIISMLLVVSITLTAVPSTVFAAEATAETEVTENSETISVYDEALDNFEFTVDKDTETVILTKYIGADSAVVIADSYFVDNVAYGAVLDSSSVFRGNTDITSVIIGSGVSFKDNSMAYLFSECKKLVSVDMTGVDTSDVIDMSYLFDWCSKLTAITGYEKWDTGKVESIYKAFNRNNSITTVDLSGWDLSNVINSGWCFQQCYAAEIKLPDNLKTISAGFLNHASKVTGSSFTIPAGVEKIGYAHTLYDFATDDFVEFIVAEGNEHYVAIDGILYSADGTEMLAVPRNKIFTDGVYEIPEGVTFLGELSFSRNYNINTLVLPDSYVIEYVPLNDSRYIVYEDIGNINAGTNLSIAIYCYTGITEYAVKDSNPNYTSLNGIIYSKDMSEVVAIPARYAQEIVIPEGVTTWNMEAMWADFENNSQNTLAGLLVNCTGVSIPASLKLISEDQLAMLNLLYKNRVGTDNPFNITIAEGNSVFALDENEGLVVKEHEHSYENGICIGCGEVITLDSIAWENLTYRDIFITNNKAYLDGFNGKTFSPYVQNTGTNAVVSDAYYTAPYSLAAFGATSQQIKSVDKMPAGDYFIASKVYCTRYAVGELGVCLFSTTIGVTEVTDGFVTASGILSSQTEGRIFIGSIHSADLDGYVDDTVVVNMSIFDTAPTEAELTQLYEQYVELEKAIPREEVPYTEQECLDAFVECMNEKAAVIGMTNSSFVGPIGTDNITTASDLLRLMVYAYTNYPELNNIWNHSSYTVTVNGENARKQTVESTVIKAALEDYYHILGGKTGTLSKFNARNLAVILEIPDSDDKLAIVALYADGLDTDENNRFEAVRQIADAALAGDTDADVCCAGAIACLIPADGADMDAPQILYEKDADTQRVPASITKVLAAVCAMDIIADMEYMVTYSDFDTDIGNYYKGDFLPGDGLTFRDALYAMLLPSSNVTARMVGREAGNALLNGVHFHTYQNGLCTGCGASVLDGDYTQAIPESQGVQNAIDRAYSLTDVEWTPVADVPGVQKIDGEYTVITFEAGKTYKGIPYSGVTSNDCYVGLNVNLESFLTALKNENSVLYTENLHSTNQKSATYFGTVCSKFVQYALDVPGSYNTNNVANIPGMETIALPGEYTVDQIKLGDVVLNTSAHTTICTGILYDEDGNVAFIEISEAVMPLVRRQYWSVEEFYEHFANYRLCRYDYIDEVPALDEIEVENDYALMPRMGNKYNYKVSSTKGVVDILKSGYSKAVIVRDGIVIEEIALSDENTFTFDRSIPGYLEMYLEKEDGTRSDSVYACVVKSSVVVEDAVQFVNGKLTVNIDGSNGEPLYVQVGSAHAIFCNVEGQSGTVELTFSASKISTQQVRVAYQNEYGIYLSSWVTFTAEENPSNDPLLSLGKYWNGYNITPSSPTPVVQSNKVDYWSYTMIPVEENTTYYSKGSTRLWYLDSNGASISTYNAYKDSDVPFQFTTPEGTAYVNIAYSPNLVEQGTETLVHVHTYENGACIECGYWNGPVITRQPENITVAIDENFSVVVEADGEYLTYQWYQRNLFDEVFIPSSNTSNVYTDLMKCKDNTREIYCVITDGNGVEVITNTVTVSLAEGQTHKFNPIITEPTCLKQGFTTHTCEYCGETYVDSYVDKTAHEMTSWGIIKEATCMSTGLESRSCQDCEYEEYRALSKLVHEYEEKIVEATCTAKGYTDHVCKACGDSYTDAHVDKAAHTYGLWHTTKTSSCTSDGEEARECSVCGVTETRRIEKSSHSYKDTVTVPTCTSKGYTEHYCETCGNSYVDNYVDKTAHEMNSWVITKKPTCTELGLQRHDCKHCSYYELQDISELGHSYSADYTVDKSATSSAKGLKSRHCTNAGCTAKTSMTEIEKPVSFTLSYTRTTYNGNAKYPAAMVKDANGKKLVKGKDYTVTAESGRKYPGNYTMKITLKGEYSGTKTLSFTIAPKATTKVWTSERTTSSITLKWNKVTGADGYRVFKYNTATKKYEKVKDVTSTSLKITGLKAGTNYSFKVKAYTKDEGTIWGSYSLTYKTATKPKTPTITKISSSKGKASLTWSNVSGETGYQLYYATKKNGEYKLVTSYAANKVQGTKTKLTSGKTYYFKVRAYKKTDQGTVYSSWSDVKSIKIK